MTKPLQFVLLGAAGYVAPRHMKAIKDVGGELIAIYDPHDSVGVIDQFFPECKYFKDFSRLDRWAYDTLIDYVSICSPNHMHATQSRWAMMIGADAICEKPATLTSKNLHKLIECEDEYRQKVNVILQLRLHPEVQMLKNWINQQIVYNPEHKLDCVLDYMTLRGPWYEYSWKGNKAKSGGICTNIGIHLFDLLVYLFGMPIKTQHDVRTTQAHGMMIFAHANVRWNLTIDSNDLIDAQSCVRRLSIDNKQFDFTNGFTDLHTVSYQRIIDGHGFGLEDAKYAISLVEKMRC